jgi:methylmalonyl-CoA mutase
MVDPNSGPLSLAAEFPVARRKQWLALVDSVLKGWPFERLTSRTYDGLAIEPLYGRAAAASTIVARAPAAPWQMLQRVDHPDPAAANEQALHDLENGASGLSVVFAGAVGAHGFGLPPTADALERALDGVFLDAGVAIELDLTPQAKDAALGLAQRVVRRGIAPAAVDIRFGFDPLGAQAMSGSSLLPWRDLAPIFSGILGELSRQGFRGPFAPADGRVIHASGGSEAQELAFVLAVAVSYLRALEAAGIALDAARRMLFFRLAADADQFLTIAKFRALRQLWARVEEACGLTPQPIFISAETAWRMMTRRDPYVNMLRTTVAVFSAAVGGADAITVLPFTAALGLPDRFARRVARNTQLILADESNLAKVADPAAGTGAFEDLTDQLARAAWTLFQDIEKVGGIEDALARGLVQEKVAQVRSEREKAIAHRREALTGTSEFPHLAEAPVSVLDVAPFALPPAAPEGLSFRPLAPVRLAEPYEALRDASDRMLADSGARPKAFLANLGKPSDFLTRATFAKNFFEAGGIEAMSNDGFASHAEMAAAFQASGARLACLCSSDALYATEAASAAEALTRAGALQLCLAGRPGELEAPLRAAGVQTFVYAGGNALATLRSIHDILQKDQT